jgi:hypothetical protein
MKRCHFIGVDVHCQFSEVAAINASGRVVHKQRCATSIPALVEQLRTQAADGDGSRGGNDD